MGRMEAKGKVDRKTGEVRRAPKVTPEMMHEWGRRENVELRGAGVDESPHCYKRLPEVLGEHQGSIKTLHTLRPLGVGMAGAHELAPTKDWIAPPGGIHLLPGGPFALPPPLSRVNPNPPRSWTAA